MTSYKGEYSPNEIHKITRGAVRYNWREMCVYSVCLMGVHAQKQRFIGLQSGEHTGQ
jgi:hypothetical protein